MTALIDFCIQAPVSIINVTYLLDDDDVLSRRYDESWTT